MALDYEVPRDKRLLYWLGDKLIEYRHPVSVVVILVTAVFAYWGFQLQLVTSFGDLLPQDHPYIKIHNRYSGTFGGANNINVMIQVKEGSIFTVETLNKIWKMTEGLDKVYGVNHNQIDSIAHRTVRYLKVAAGGTMRAQPVMLEPVKTPEEAANIRRIVHNAENIYGLLVSLDDKAALIRANFIEGRLDYKRIFTEVNENVVHPFADANTEVFVAGEPRLYGWVYNYAGDVFFILVVTYCIEWVLRWMYFHDWRGSLRPTITGLIAAFWGLGFIHLIGLALDPLMLVMPFLITARAVSHAIQMHDRYYEEFEKSGWHKRRAIVASFGELFVPTLSGITADAFGVLVILLVPVVMLQKLAITASWWILAITISEMLLNPIVYYYLKPPEPELVVMRERGSFRKGINWFTGRLLTTRGRTMTVVLWLAATLVAFYFMRGLTIGDPTAASPLLWLDSPYNVSHKAIQDKFGGVEPLIVVAEGYDKDAMKDPGALRNMERFQRYMERDPSIGYSFSLADIIRAVNMVFHELEPKWGVIPDNWVDIGGLFFIYFSGSPPTETAKYVDPSYTTAHVTFFCKDHRGENIRRIIKECKEFISGTQIEDLGITLTGQDDAAVVKTVAAEPIWEKAGPSWVVGSQASGDAPFKPGDRIVAVGKTPVKNEAEFRAALTAEAGHTTLLDFKIERGGQTVDSTVGAPWKAVFKLAGGLVGTLAAANEELVKNDVLMNFLGFFTMYMIMLFTYRSFAAGLYLLAPLALSNIMVNGYMAANDIGVNIHTLPLVTVGLGFGIDYGLYIVSRTIEEIRVRGNLEDSVREALETSGKAVTFTAVTMVISTVFWTTSNIRFNAEMGLLLAIWMAISYVGSQTLTPVLIVLFKPRFIMREANRSPDLMSMTAKRAAR
ncbi:MAG TPA: MMPL family transporter [Candidatus Margulisiibacteriota bacterium]|nr:MMPL family transporter [Candidatus Margulisiibacteriota bacterium]